MSIQTELGGVGKVRTELEEERSKVSIYSIAVVLVDHGGGTKQAWIAIRTMRSMPFRRAKGGGLLLRFAD